MASQRMQMYFAWVGVIVTLVSCIGFATYLTLVDRSALDSEHVNWAPRDRVKRLDSFALFAFLTGNLIATVCGSVGYKTTPGKLALTIGGGVFLGMVGHMVFVHWFFSKFALD